MSDSSIRGIASPPAVLPLVADEANQGLLTRWIDEHPEYTLAEGDPESAVFDLCILDTTALERFRSALRGRKDEANTLLPCLLLVPDDSGAAIRAELRRQRPALWRLVDGTVRLPLRTYDLENSVDTLLRLREQSTDLARRERQLEILNRVLRHDIRNDISVVLGWLDVLSADIPPERQSAFDRVESASEHILDLTTTTRDIVEAMTGEGDGEADLAPMNLTRAVVEEAERCRTTFETVTVDLPAAPPTLIVRANDLLSSVIRNLISNAVQHNDSDEPVVSIGLSESDGAAQIRVADNGPGVPDAIVAEIFEDEVKGLESTGTGMGLYLVSTLVEMYGGDIWTEANEPRGSVFVVELPTVDPAG